MPHIIWMVYCKARYMVFHREIWWEQYPWPEARPKCREDSWQTKMIGGCSRIVMQIQRSGVKLSRFPKYFNQEIVGTRNLMWFGHVS